MVAERATAPAAIISVFCAATMMRARSGRPRASAPRNISQPWSRVKGARLRPRRFCLVAASPRSAGPKIAQRIGDQQEDHRGGGELVAPEHAEDGAEAPLLGGGGRRGRSLVIGFASTGRAAMGSGPDAGIEQRVGEVDQEVHHEDRDRGDHDRGEDHVEVAAAGSSRSSACRRRGSRRSSRPPRRR